ncbi:MAG: ABC transporter permease [Lysobacteraceae bacterium]|nr:MAG: ABC transporter permease [Xanthomonadaceae bacterium]
MSAPRLEITSDANDAPRVRLSGDWTLPHLEQALRALEQVPPGGLACIDAAGVGALDSAGAMLWVERLGGAGAFPEVRGLAPEAAALLKLVAAPADAAVPAPPAPPTWWRLSARIGVALEQQWRQAVALLGFLGLVLATLAAMLAGRRRLRWTATVFHVEQTGLDAVPIVTLLSFLIGAVVAFLGATVLRDFGAELFTVELVGVSFLREFGPLLTAILLAGRSGSAFTAQIGSMKAREEVDAIRALGLDPVELLVLPRLLALLVSLPMLAFLAMLAGLLGGGLVGSLALEISPAMFLARLQEMTDLRHFWVGLVKTPVFATLIALVGCLEGFRVEGSAESVGRHTTSSVVQAIFLVILFDALFALLFLELDL